MQIIRTLNSGRANALLESPTGSGKSMAIICGAVAWLEHQAVVRGEEAAQARGAQADLDAENARLANGDDDCTALPPTACAAEVAPPGGSPTGGRCCGSGEDSCAPRLGGGGGGDDDDDFEQSGTAQSLPKRTCLPPSRAPPAAPGTKDAPPTGQVRLPKIYITSRTHRQISQLVSELRASAYAPKFVVIASRSHYCVNEKVRKTKDVNQACKDALAVRSCAPFLTTSRWQREAPPTMGRITDYYAKKAPPSQQQAPSRDRKNFTPDCDIEDLLAQGKKEHFCPYYVSRAAIESAQIILCPYNYLVDAAVRDAVGIDLKDDIVIIDEAHNIEDTCREAGSFEVTDATLQVIQVELTRVTKLLEEGRSPHLVTAHQAQSHVVSIIANWMRHGATTLGVVQRDFETSTTVWSGKNIIEELASLGITQEAVQVWHRELERIVDGSEDREAASSLDDRWSPYDEEAEGVIAFERNPSLGAPAKASLSMGHVQILSQMYNALDNMMRSGGRFLSSYRMVKYQTSTVTVDGKRMVTTLGFWCFNPEVTFSELASQCKSVILTSGTLSPMETFASELGTPFANRLEALHVISEKQTWVGCIPVGPSGSALLAKFGTMDSYTFQDDIAAAILQIIEIVPGGVVCFLPSYAFMEKLTQRMRRAGAYERMSKIKKIYEGMVVTRGRGNIAIEAPPPPLHLS